MPLLRRDPHAAYILLVEDEPGVRDVMRRFLEQQGYRVRVAASVPKALLLVSPDLQAAILDVILINSGGRSGIDVLAAIRSLPEGERIPVLMLTGYGLNPEVEASIARHNAELRHKPLPLATVGAWLQGALKPSE